ncbi:MAG: OmpA family protein [Flavobacteriaceae bacterium]|nr:OmpA family protein [Flavobacteriaceae bacterium]
MKKTIKKLGMGLLTLLVTLNLGGCSSLQNANNKQKGGAIGATGGAILGAIIGNNTGNKKNSELGAIIGGVVGGAAGILIGKKMDDQAQQIETEIPGAVVERVDNGIIITFDEKSGVYFDTGKSNINYSSQQTLDKLAGVLREYTDTNVLVIGHTDSAGADQLNMNLSKKRAEAVTHYFVASKGLAGQRFTTQWYGETQPKFDNTTREGRAKNRRVNVVIVPNDKMKNDAKKQSGGY